MKKFLNWIINHMRASLAILTFGVTAIVIGATMLSSFASYKDYERRYNENDLVVRSASAADPKKVEVNDNFKSKLKNNLYISADDMSEEVEDDYVASAKAGAIELKLEIDATALVDIDLEVRSALVEADEEKDIENLFANITFSVNGSAMDREVKLEAGDFHHVVLSGFAIPEGKLTISLKGMNNKANYVPDVRSMTVYSNANVDFLAE